MIRKEYRKLFDPNYVPGVGNDAAPEKQFNLADLDK